MILPPPARSYNKIETLSSNRFILLVLDTRLTFLKVHVILLCGNGRECYSTRYQLPFDILFALEER
jgi:hypothetical protein